MPSVQSTSKGVVLGGRKKQVRQNMFEHLWGVRLREEKPINAHFDENHISADIKFSFLEKLYMDYNEWIKR